MKENNLHKKITNATKWSSITEVAAKLVSPVTNMILARILTPEAFGVVATVTMIMSFADMFTDAGFQKYLVQHQFKDDDEKYRNANVAFWTNFVISILFWGIIAIFSEQLATIVGNPGLGNVIVIACFQLPLTSFSSIQMALYRRNFDFKTLFYVRMISVCIPFVVTLPLAILGFSYWSLIIGTLFVQFSNAVILTHKSKWKPKLEYNIKIIKEMFSFSIWSLVESISIWLTAWLDAFIIGGSLNQYYLGLYKISTSIVNQVMGIITGATVPILFSALSRLQEDRSNFNNLYFKVQKFVSIIVFPLGMGIYVYSDLVTKIFLGSQWGEASNVIGVWSLTSSITIVFGYYCSEVYRAKGKPNLSFLSQLLHLVVLVPTCIISSSYGFWPLVYARSWIRIQMVLVHFVIMKFCIGISVRRTFKNVIPTAFSAIAMGILGHFLQLIDKELLWSFVSIIICSLFYFGVLYLFPNMRKEMNGIVKKLKEKFIKSKYIKATELNN